MIRIEDIVASTHPWQRQPNETPKAYAAFAVYRDLGVGRSIDKAYAATRAVQRQADGKSASRRASRYWMEWSTKYHWVERVTAYDDHLMQKLQDEYEANLLIRQQQALRAGFADAERMLKLFAAKLEEADTFDLEDMNRLVLFRSRLEDLKRRALRMPVSTTDVTSGGEPIRSAPTIEFVWADMNDNGGHDDSSDTD